MNLPQRFEQAVRKLYRAFHNDELNPECCRHCAVGNILDNQDHWKHFTEKHGSLELTYVGLVNEKFGKRFNGYSPTELLKIEAAFLKGCGYVLPMNREQPKPDSVDKDTLFMGLSEVITHLCKLEGISNVMDCSALFDYQLSHSDPISEAIAG